MASLVARADAIPSIVAVRHRTVLGASSMS
jgi:hypothetical protein